MQKEFKLGPGSKYTMHLCLLHVQADVIADTPSKASRLALAPVKSRSMGMCSCSKGIWMYPSGGWMGNMDVCSAVADTMLPGGNISSPGQISSANVLK